MGGVRLLGLCGIAVYIALARRTCFDPRKELGGLLPVRTYHRNGNHLAAGQKCRDAVMVQDLLHGLGVILVFDIQRVGERLSVLVKASYGIRNTVRWLGSPPARSA